MRASVFLSRSIRLAGLAGLIFIIGCGNETAPEPGRLRVVLTSDIPHRVSSKKIEVLDGESSWTNESGVAEFVLAEGAYTVKAYDVGGGLPGPPDRELHADVRSGEITTLDLYVCYTCDAPTQGLVVSVVRISDGRGVPQTRVRLLPDGDQTLTDERGLAYFGVPPGHYTVQAFGLQTGGPGVANPIRSVEVTDQGAAVVEFVSCDLCY